MKYRVRVLHSLSRAESAKSEQGKAFVLTHTYDERPRPLYLKGPYSIDSMNVLIAYIQYESFELDDVYGMDQVDVAEVLSELYDCEVSEEPIQGAAEIDLYLNWEEWCGVADNVSSLKVFKNERLSSMLQKYIDAWKDKSTCRE